MTKILYVHGDDYAASDFQKLRDTGAVNPTDLWAESDATGDSCEYVTEQVYFEFTALEFGPVDPKFIEWIKSEQDYDASKTANFYLVE